MPADDWLKQNDVNATVTHLSGDMYCRELTLSEQNELLNNNGSVYDSGAIHCKYAVVRQDGTAYFHTPEQIDALFSDSSSQAIADLAGKCLKAQAERREKLTLATMKKKLVKTGAGGS